jgi:hypothetical protein
MNDDIDYLSVHGIADQAINAWLASRSPGLALSIDIGRSFFDFSADNSSRAFGHRFLRYPTLLRHRSHRRSQSLPVKPVNVLSEPILFARTDGFVRSAADEEITESYGPRIEEVATRSIDSWIVGRPDLRLLHLGDPQLALDQLRGAAETLARDRPLLTIYPANLDRNALESALRHHGYRTFDLAGQPVLSDALSSELGFGWIAVPLEFDATHLFEAAQASAAGLRRSALQQAMSRNALPRQRRSSSLFGLSGGSTLPLTYSLDANGLVAEHDCYPIETDGTHAWRWLGPRPRARLAVPCPIPGPYRFQLSILDCHLNDGLASCRIIAGGQETMFTVEGERSGVIRFMAYAPADSFAGYIEVDVVTLGSVTSVGSDRRTLRLSIQSVTVSPWQ